MTGFEYDATCSRCGKGTLAWQQDPLGWCPNCVRVVAVNAELEARGGKCPATLTTGWDTQTENACSLFAGHDGLHQTIVAEWPQAIEVPAP